MFLSKAEIMTASAQRCLTRLCRHWGHKFTVSFDAEGGEVQFEPARCLLQVVDGGLRVTVETPDEGELAELEAVVGEHLQRMASPEQLGIRWVRLRMVR